MTKLALLLTAVVACAGDDGGPNNPCPTGNCTLPGRTTVKWTFNAYPERMFSMDSCIDFGVSKLAVDMVDSAGTVTSITDACGNGQIAFSGLPAGEYTVNLMPVDAGGNGLLTAPVTGTVTAGQTNDNREVTLNVPWDAWLNAATATGTFLFKITWGGMSCETTSVKYQTVKLTVGGVVQTVTSDWNNQTLDGTDKKACKMSSDSFPQAALGVKFGLATLEITGYDMSNAELYTHSFDTFVGAGINNPTLTFDVPTL